MTWSLTDVAALDVKDYPITETWTLALSHSPQGRERRGGGRDGEGWLNEEEMEGKSESDGKGNEREIGGREDKRKG